MRLIDIRISNYRSIKDEQHILFNKLTTLIGPNNSGKTNALRAISLLFGGYDNTQNYSRNKDLPIDRQSKQTSIIATINIPNHEKWFWDKFQRLHELQGTEQKESTIITLYLYFNTSNTPIYGFFANAKRPSDKKSEYSRILRTLVTDLIEKFSVIYIPSEKSIVDLYSQLLAPRVSNRAASILSSALTGLRDELNSIGQSINKTLIASGIPNCSIEMEVPGGQLKNILGEFNLTVTDSVKTSYTQKGRGLQAAIFYASLHWIDERIKEEGKIPLWLIEEPESYMHPELAKNCREMIKLISEKSFVTISTHSMQFLPKDPEGIHSFSLKETATNINRHLKYDEACNTIKKSLGLRFSDYYSLGESNILLEGKWDTYTIKTTLAHVKNIANLELNRLSNAVLIEKDGLTALTGFLKAVYEHTKKEVALVAVFDGDEAGVRHRKELQGFFGKQGGYHANTDYVSVRSGYPLEGIFPDLWISECYQTHKNWFKTWSTDSAGNIEPFEINDENKGSYAEYMCEKVLETEDPTTIQMLINLLMAIESALENQHKRLIAIR